MPALAGYALVRVYVFWPGRSGVGADRYGDAGEYLRISHVPFLSTQFFTDHKPFGYPLFLKLLGGAAPTVAWAQLAISIVAWSVLAVLLARRAPSPVARAGLFVSVLAFSTASPVAQWDPLMLTESLSLSLLALLVAALVCVVARPAPANVTLLVTGAVLFAGLRDTNGLLACALLVVAAACSMRTSRTGAAVLVAVAVAAIALPTLTAAPRRWVILVGDQIGKRVVHQPEALHYFRTHGMPLPRGLSQMIFRDTRHPHPAATFERDPRLATFMPWFLAHGQQTFKAYLLSHPGASVAQPAAKLPLLLSADGLSTYRAPGFSAPEASYLPSGRWLLALGAALAGLGLIGVLRGVAQRTWAAPFALLATSVPLAIVTWDGEPSEIPRHELVAAVDARLGLLAGVWLVGAALWRDAASAYAWRRWRTSSSLPT